MINIFSDISTSYFVSHMTHSVVLLVLSVNLSRSLHVLLVSNAHKVSDSDWLMGCSGYCHFLLQRRNNTLECDAVSSEPQAPWKGLYYWQSIMVSIFPHIITIDITYLAHKGSIHVSTVQRLISHLYSFQYCTVLYYGVILDHVITWPNLYWCLPKAFHPVAVAVQVSLLI